MRRNSEREVEAGLAPGFAQRGYIARQGGYKTGYRDAGSIEGPKGCILYEKYL